MPEPQVTEGQAESTDLTETTATAPGGNDGQSAGTDQTTASGPDAGTQTGESFFDPKTIEHSPELMQAYKQMQGAFSKKMGGIRENLSKVEQYDQFMANPSATIRQLAQQYGMTLVDGQPQPAADGQDFKPQSWDDVTAHVRQQVINEMNAAYEPLVGQVKDLKRQNVEQFLDANFTDWKTYETEMIQNLQKHPSLAEDPTMLYNMSVPPELLEARATERALKKLKGDTSASAVAGAKPAAHTPTNQPEGKLSFNEAVQFAKQKLRKQGIGPVAG
jgi:hypothetical protein